MIWIYLAAAIFGCAFVIPMVLGGIADADLGDFEMDGPELDGPELDGPEIDAVDLETTNGGAAADFAQGWFGGDTLGAIFASLLSFRTLVFFSAFFGVGGLVFGAFGYSPGATAASAVLVGAIAALANSVLFGLVKSSQANSQISDRTLEGRPAVVVLPMQQGQRGRIRIELSGQTQYIVARPIPGDEESFDVGASVVVVKVEDGTAQVASIAELDISEET